MQIATIGLVNMFQLLLQRCSLFRSLLTSVCATVNPSFHGSFSSDTPLAAQMPREAVRTYKRVNSPAVWVSDESSSGVYWVILMVTTTMMLTAKATRMHGDGGLVLLLMTATTMGIAALPCK